MASTMYIFPQYLPDASKPWMDFRDTAFFRANRPNPQFPRPEEVRRPSGINSLHPKLTPVVFEDLSLIVKYGPDVKITEAQCLWIIRHVLGSAVPVPEVYGWRVDGRDVFLYMQLIRGHRLKDRWDSMTITEKSSICEELRGIATALRQVKQDPSDPFIGSIDRQGSLDYVFKGMPGGRPFTTVKDFNDWISWLPQNDLPDSQKYSDPYRPHLPDNDSIVLTHGDLHRGNIIVSSTSPPHIEAVVDWGRAGWCPAFWEYCKALYTASFLDEWRNQWIPRFLTPRDAEFGVLSEYFLSWEAV